MNMKKRTIFGILVAWALASQVLGAQQEQEPVYLQLGWQPGQTLRYKLNIQSNVNADGERLQMGVESEVALYIVRWADRADVKSENGTKRDLRKDSQTVSLGERLMEIKLEYGQLRTRMSANGQKLVINVGKDDISAYLNGSLLPSYQMRELRSEMRELQEILRAPIRFWMTRSGKVVRVSGLEKLDPATQKQLAMDFFQSMELPEKPMRIGDQFITNRNLDSLFANQHSGDRSVPTNRTIEIVRTLKQITPDETGRRVAEISAPFTQEFEDMCLDEDGTRGSADIDILCTTLVDVERGGVIQETVKGTVLLHPNGGAGVPDRVKVDLDVTLQLIEKKELRELAHKIGGIRK